MRSSFPTDETIDPATLARATEARGLTSLWFPEHTHIPTSRTSPWPGGAELPRHYYRTYDPFVALAVAAAVTTTLKLGTGICLVIERDPIVTAKEVASLDRLSGGRFQFGIGAGWNIEEMSNHGTDPSTRFALMAEQVAAMKALWTEDEAEFHGRHVQVERSFLYPKPLQTPHPPIYLGGDGPTALDRVVRYADAWLPIPARGAVSFADRVKELQDKAVAAAGHASPFTSSAHHRAPRCSMGSAMPAPTLRSSDFRRAHRPTCCGPSTTPQRSWTATTER